ncbi:3-hydroxyacyl-CoA dehydrogenase [Frigoribacterium sp. CFBP 8754]|uniref:3-hydroxyacyl-CoA dehydrogenase n=1 Tax=unclassified Frigoribacterium TaxID=2627005 RepID=UPI0009EB6454|nr:MULTISPECIES: 3-hydroxyacyl-CoA dehydrogenase [unclassified Frigoribacterium]MBD8661452.1 3-hydroxyacyl-CoA dehydrogenase [Frigoribacterium sp. CFBP 8754]MBD8729457.1 3-hydroxyacyl-CoA dehydrogenase [Frigoribacterium sp. CFBP 13707]
MTSPLDPATASHDSDAATASDPASATPLSRVTVLGTGVLGAQIAFQAAYTGSDVVAYDIGDEQIAVARARFEGLAATYLTPQGLRGATEETTREALRRVTFSTDLAEAVADADLVVEAVPESLELKRDLYARLAPLLPERTVLATNSSTLLPSDLVDATGRPEKFLALHFANLIWVNNTAEVMGTPATSPEVFRAVVEFARGMGMVPIELKKEQPGYVLNSLLVPLLNAASALLVKGVADPETVDTTWRIGTGAPFGPFQIMDVVGLRTVHAVSVAGGPEGRAFAEMIQRDYLDRGATGRESGEGFYSYPAPSAE